MTDHITFEMLLNDAQQFITTLSQASKTFASAESCTGGLLCSTLTDISGSSRVVMGGIISYSNEAKQTLLDVPEAILLADGAVSATTAEAMARGAQARFQVDYAISVTGIAGPAGGTAEKPVGLVYIGMATPSGHIEVSSHLWQYDRINNKRASVRAGLQMVLTHLKRP